MMRRKVYKFGSYIFNGQNLTRDGVAIDIPRQERRLLQILVEQAIRDPEGKVSDEEIKKEIKDYVWPDQEFVDDINQSLRSVAHKLRKRLGYQPDGHLYITVTDYRLTAPVEVVEAENNLPAKPIKSPGKPTSKLEGVNHLVFPYPGPQEFPERMADKFFGRTKECEELLGHINGHRIVLVDAPSGAGKSSLLNTLIRRGLEEKFDVLMGVRIGGALPSVHKSTDIRNVFTFAAAYSLTLPPNPMSRLDDCLRSISRKPETQGRVLILDQFEELFTQHPERHEDRAVFFQELIDALVGDDSLRVVLAIRKEYVSDVELLAERLLPRDLPMRRFKLKRMERPNIVEAIMMPIADYTEFADGVVDEIVDQLNIIKVPGPDGVPVEKHGEFIEMVHLQIVCERLWRSLPQGIKRIERDHLQQAAGEDKTFKEFVVNALDEFYNDTVEKVANSEETRAHGKYSQELIRFGCMQFVTPASTRRMVRRAHGHTGRLPDWIVNQLEKYYLLRCEERGGERWYELAHDRLVEPVIQQRDDRVNSLLYAADLLEKVLGRVLEECDGDLTDYFVEHRDMLRACQPFRRQTDLFQDEAEFLFRASLVDSLRRAQVWSKRLGKDYPKIRLKVLSEALRSGLPEVRRHSVGLLGRDPIDELLPALARLATEDEDASVRRAAAESLALLDAKRHNAELMLKLLDDAFNKPHDPANHSKVEAALSHIRISTNWHGHAPSFQTYFRKIGRLRQLKIRARAFALQLWEGLPILLCIIIPAGFFAAISAALFKLIPGFFGWALTQVEGNAGPGFFQGFTAGVIWAGGIVLGLTVYYIVSEREHDSKPPLSQFYAVVVGTISGLLGSVIIVFVVVAVFNMSVLENIGWILPNRKRFSADFWLDLSINTRYAWLYIITGSGLGVGMALTTNRLRTSEKWINFKETQNQLKTFRQLLGMVWEIMQILIRHVWPIPVMLLIAGTLAFFVPNVVHDGHGIRAGSLGLAQGLVGDCATQAVGAYFGIVGMGLGIVIVRWGFTLRPRRF